MNSVAHITEAPVSRIKSAAPLAIILIAAFALRCRMFSGLVGSDDLAYSLNAFQLLHGDFHPTLSPLSNRIGFIGLLSACFLFFGHSEYSLILPSFASSMLQIVLAFLLLKRAGKPRAGLIAAGLLALSPWDAIFATRGYSDIPSSTAFALFVFLAWRPESVRKSSKFAAPAAGFCLGFAYLFKEMALFQMIFWAPFLLWAAVTEKKGRIRDLVATASGALSIFLIESLWYLHSTGDFWYRLRGVESGYNRSEWSGAALYGSNYFDRVFIQAPKALLVDPTFLFMFSAGLLAYLYIRSREKSLWPIFGWLAFDLAFFATGSSSLGTFNPIPLFQRYLLIMLFPAALLVGTAIDFGIEDIRLRSVPRSAILAVAGIAVAALAGAVYYSTPLSWVAAAALMAGVLPTAAKSVRIAGWSLAFAAASIVLAGLLMAYPFSQSNSQPEKKLYEFVSKSPLPVYSDERTLSILQFFDHYKTSDKFRDFQKVDGASLRNAWVIVNEPRMAFLINTYHYKPPGWVLDSKGSKMKLVAKIGKGKPGTTIYVFHKSEM